MPCESVLLVETTKHKTQIANKLQVSIFRSQTKKYDLEDRTLLFAERVRAFIRKVPKNICNIEDRKQLAKASGSTGANCIRSK